MSTSISLLGLNRFSGSLGLALTTREGLALTAYANDPDTARIAHSRGMAQRSEWNLLNAVAGADVVVLAMPLGPGGTLDTLRLIGPELRAGCVVICLTSLLSAPLHWAAEHLPAERHFIALHPILSPAHLYDGTSGLDAADANLFTGALWAMAASTTCAPEALKLASDLGLLVKATPYFVDPAEHDGLMGGTSALPGMLAWALMRAASGSTGWSEMRKVADREFATATTALMEADAHALTLNRVNVVRYLDAALADLQALRTEIERDNTVAVAEMLAEAEARRAQWQADRQRGEWDAAARPNVDIPTPGQSIQKLFVGNLLSRKDDKKNKP